MFGSRLDSALTRRDNTTRANARARMRVMRDSVRHEGEKGERDLHARPRGPTFRFTASHWTLSVRSRS